MVCENYPLCEECFEKNFVTGRKLVLLEARHLPKMGITNFEDIKAITAAIRGILNTKLIEYFRNISLPRREPWALYLEEYSRTGKTAEKLKYPTFLKERKMKHTDP
ncbi:sterile alpha motif domain-containing protein 15-like isoform X2 [Stegodyphus dumicola]|uniref:sterile alpha motif domain-containing protein 15-like isoform X2 n=1 Tax=Stegodyphus dumicola TaxID=202533 RepID=UPI0015B1F415|nr:sterile alpha motif domain-containing protein 15-like isoform X2 [Stegodyphus dumicola]